MTVKWYTCTPVSFVGDDTFFFRDTGLLCRGLQAAGYESRVVMPLPAREGDYPEVLRTEFDNLCSPAWWASLGLEGVLIYSWADPKYNSVVRAIRQAGIRLFVNLDNDGIISPYSAFFAYLRHQYDRLRFTHSASASAAMTLLKTAMRLGALGAIDYRRMVHLRQADLVGVVSPVATERIRRYCRRLGCARLANRVAFIPHPISPQATYANERKERAALFVGRWDDRFQKNPELLVETIRACVIWQSGIHFHVFGRGLADKLSALYASCPEARLQVTYQEFMPHDALLDRMKHCRVAGCTSRYESFHLVSAEALCCGCSVVGPLRSAAPAFQWFVSHGSGTGVTDYTADGFADALDREMAQWDAGGRDAGRISAYWRDQLHVKAVLAQLLKIIEG